MSRCKVTDHSSSIQDCPPPYSRYEVNEHLAVDNTHPFRLNAIRQSEIRTTANTGKIVSRRCCSYCVGGLFAFIFCTFLIFAVFPYPLKASCTIQWGFEESCTFAMKRLRCQILTWTSCNDSDLRGNRCLYALKKIEPFENNTIRATHLSPNLKLIDDISIEFTDTRNNSCTATAKSESRAWFMVFDYGTNYCNLRNLVNGAKLHMDRGFMELTNNAVCTQRSSALCS